MHTDIRIDKAKVGKSCFFFVLAFAYIASALLSFRLSSGHTYIFIANFAAIIFYFFVLLLIRSNIFLSHRMLALFLLCSLSILTVITSGLSWAFVFYVYFFISVVCLYNARETFSRYVGLISCFYLTLVALALFNYSLNDILLGDRQANSFELSFCGFNFQTIYGFEGSTAHIDSISAIAALMGIFYYKGTMK